MPERERPRLPLPNSILGKADDAAVFSFCNLFLLELPSALCEAMVCLVDFSG